MPDQPDTALLVAPPSIPTIIQRYLNGESLQDLARESQVHARTLYRWILAETGPEYDHIITECLTNRIADADLNLETATDTCQVARAREQARFARMDYERRRPKLYGPKQELEVDNKLTIIVQRQGRQPDSQPVQVIGQGTGQDGAGLAAGQGSSRTEPDFDSAQEDPLGGFRQAGASEREPEG